MPTDLYKFQIFANFLAIFLGPVTAVLITLWFQRRKEKRDAKHRAFLVLMAHRKTLPPNFEMVQILNTLDVLFSKNRKIVELWHKYYALLALPPSEERNHTWLELLTEIAKDLNYPTLTQTDLDKFYTPQYYDDQFELQNKIQKEFLRVLENTTALVVHPKEDSKQDGLHSNQKIKPHGTGLIFALVPFTL